MTGGRDRCSHVTMPAVLGHRGVPVPYRVSPTRRFEWAWQRMQRDLDAMPGIFAAGSRQTTSSPNATSVDQRTRVGISELGFPGRSSDQRSPVGKWAYIFHVRNRQCVVEAQALPRPGASASQVHPRWSYRVGEITPDSLNQSHTDPIVTDSWIEFDTRQDDQPQDFWAFLTPVRLSPDGLRFLLDQIQRHGANEDRLPLTRLRWNNTYTAYGWVPDPFSWAIDAQDRYHVPSVDNWMGYTQDADRHARVFVATVLKGWIDAGMTGWGNDIRNNLASGQPNRFLDQYQREERRHGHEARQAAAYLCQCLDSPEHRAVELSGMDRGGNDLSCCVQQWGIVSTGLMATRPGQEYLLHLMEQDDRLPVAYVFSENTPPNAPAYGQDRYAWIGARQLIVNTMAAWYELQVNRATRDAQAPERVRRIIETRLNELYPTRRGRTWRERTIARELRTGAPLGSTTTPARRGRLMARFWEIAEDAMPNVDPREVLRKADETAAAASSRLPDLERKSADWSRLENSRLNKFMLAGQGIAEVWNLVSAISAVHAAWNSSESVEVLGVVSMSQRDFQIVGAVGAVADAAAFAFDLGRVAGASWAGAGSTLAKCAGPIAIISGFSEFLSHGTAAHQAYGQHNPTRAVGSATAAIGGLMTAVGGGLALAAQLGLIGSAAGPVGAIIGIIGGVLIAAGSIIAMLASRTPYEQFAEFCFLGDSPNDDPFDLAFLPVRWPTRNIHEQVAAALHLLAAFKIEKVGSGNPGHWGTSSPPDLRVRIRPGLFPPESSIDVVIQFEIRTGAYFDPRTVWTTRLRLDAGADTPTYVGNPQIIIHGGNLGTVQRTAGGTVEHLTIPLRPGFFWREGMTNGAIRAEDHLRGASFDAIRVYVRTHIPGQPPVNSPPRGKHCMLDIMDDEDVSSLDTGAYRVAP